MGDAREFARDLDAFGVRVEADAVATKRAAALEILAGCIAGNPVGNPALWKVNIGRSRRRRYRPKGYVGGYSRGNWQLTSGAPASGAVERRSAGSASTAGERAAKDINLERTTWITNNAPYIGRLEFGGHSSQAPDGWARAVVERARARYE